MIYAILAAGQGSRLSEEGIAASKPMVELEGMPLIDRLMCAFMKNDAAHIYVVMNAEQQDTMQHLAQLRGERLGAAEQRQGSGVPLDYMVRLTPSSMHSFYELSPWLQEGPFIMTTVDTVVRTDEFKGYVDAFRRVLSTGEADGLMGVTDYIDDEKPLYVCTDAQGQITDFLDSDPAPRYVSAGIYGLTPRMLQTLHHCMERGESRMRNYQRALLRDGFRLKAFPFSKVIDIDHASDIPKAEALLKE